MVAVSANFADLYLVNPDSKVYFPSSLEGQSTSIVSDIRISGSPRMRFCRIINPTAISIDNELINQLNAEIEENSGSRVTAIPTNESFIIMSPLESHEVNVEISKHSNGTIKLFI